LEAVLIIIGEKKQLNRLQPAKRIAHRPMYRFTISIRYLHILY